MADLAYLNPWNTLYDSESRKCVFVCKPNRYDWVEVSSVENCNSQKEFSKSNLILFEVILPPLSISFWSKSWWRIVQPNVVPYIFSDMFMIDKDFPSFLGGVKYDSNGTIVSAEATLMFFFSKMNVTEAHLEQVQEESILGDQVHSGVYDTLISLIIFLIDLNPCKITRHTTCLGFSCLVLYPGGHWPCYKQPLKKRHECAN